MTAQRPTPSAPSLSLLLPWLILAVTLLATWLVWDHEREVTRRAVRTQFDFALRDTVSRVEQRMAAYEQMLRGVQGLFATTDLNNRDAVHDYIESLQINANFSGLQVIGLVERVSSANKAAHMVRMRQLGFDNYAILPEGERDIYAPIIQRESANGAHPAPLGFDTLTVPVRKLAMETAANSGMATITGKVRLVIDNIADAPPAFVMYLPVFARDQPHETLMQRQTHLIGWVYAAFHMREFMASLYGKQAPGINLTIYDGADPSAEALMYRAGDLSDKPLTPEEGALRVDEYMVVGGHSWLLQLEAQREFEDIYGRDVASVIGMTGIALSLSLAVLSWLLVTGRARALRLAAEITEELRHMAQHDTLTGLPNRALFSDRLNRELARAKRQDGRFALIFLDLDNFKPINDTHGHAVGDVLLQQVARRLQEAVRASDTVGRIGGDEFVVLVPELATLQAALGLAEKIRQTISEPFVLDGQPMGVTCSLGIAVYPENGITEIALAKSADEAMYRAKQSGRDGVHLAV